MPLEIFLLSLVNVFLEIKMRVYDYSKLFDMNYLFNKLLVYSYKNGLSQFFFLKWIEANKICFVNI